MTRLVLCLALLLAGCTTRPVLVVATEAAFPPFNDLDERGLPVGFEMDLIDEIAAMTGDDVVWLIQPQFARLFDEIDSGRADVIASTVSVTEQRQDDYLFTHPYYHTGIGVLVHESSRSLVWSPDEIEGLRVGASAGTTSVDAARRLGAASIIVYRYSNDAVAALREGRIAAYLVDLVEARSLVDEGVVLLEEPAAIESYALLAAKGRDRLVARLNSALMEMQRSGRLARLRADYGLE